MPWEKLHVYLFLIMSSSEGYIWSSILAWFQQSRTFLLQYGFKQSKADDIMFFFCKRSLMKILLVYMDDIVLMGTKAQVIDIIISIL